MKIFFSFFLSLFLFSPLYAENDPFFSGLAQSSASQDRVSQEEVSEDVLWSKPFPAEGRFGKKARSALEDWAEQVTPVDGLSLQDFIDNADQGEVKALLKTLKSMVLTKEPSTDDKYYQTKKRYFEFDKNLLHTRGNLKDSHLDLSRVSLDQFMDARTSGWGDRQDDEDDVYLVRDFLFRIQKSIESRSGKSNIMLKRIRAKIHSLVGKAIHAFSRTENGSDARGVLSRWKSLKTASSPDLLRNFPWEAVADNDPGVGRFRSAFEWGNSIISHLVLSYIRLYSVELIFWFSQNPKLREQLAALSSIGQRVNLLEAERKLPQRSSKLWVHDLVSASREEPAFRSIAGKVFQVYFSFVPKPRSFRPQLDFLHKRVGDVLALEEVQKAIQQMGFEKVDQTLKDYLEEPTLNQTFESIARIHSVTGASISKQAQKAFEKEAGISFVEFAATGGDRQKLEDLVRGSISSVSDPAAADARVQSIHSASKKLLSSGALDSAIEAARAQKVSNSLEASTEGSKYFSIENGNLVLNGALFQKIQNGGNTEGVDIAYKGFKVEVQETQSRLTTLKNISQELQGSLDEIEFLVDDLKTMGVELEEGSGSSYLDEARKLSKNLETRNREVREAVKNLDTLKEKFEHARDRLATVLKIDPAQLGSSPQELTQRIKEHLASSAFDDEKLEKDLNEILGLLAEINSSAAEMESLAELIQKNQEELSKMRARLLNRIRASQKRKDLSEKRREELRKMHADLYPRVHYLTEAERGAIQKSAPMAARIDSAMANAFAGKYLTGFIRKSNKAKNRVEKINFSHIGKEVFRVAITLVHLEMSPDFSEKEIRKVISLDLVPRVVKTEDGNFDFLIKSLRLQRDGKEAVELKTEFGIVLDSTMTLLNQLVEQLNDTPYAQLRFRYFPHLSLLRIKNGIPIFSSFPSFKISDVHLEEGTMHFFGGIPGKELGEFIGKNVLGGEKDSLPGAKSPVKRSTQPQNMEDYEKVEMEEQAPAGDVSIRISQKLINDFYIGFRKGFLINHHHPVQDTSLEGRVTAFFRGLKEFGMGYLPEGRMTSYFRGDLTQISKETADFYNSAIKIIAPFQGFRQGLKQGASNVIRFVTFGQVEIEVDPDDYKIPSGQFAIALTGTSEFKNPALEMKFEHLSLYDPVNHGALQPYIKLVKVAASVARLAGKVRDGLKSVINLIPGVEMEISGENLDEVIFSYLAKMLVSQINQNINGVKISPRSYKEYLLFFQDFSLIPGTATTIKNIEIQKGTLLLESRIH